VLVSKAPRKQWWRNYRDPGPADVLLHGRTLHGRAHVLPAESAAFQEAIDRTFRRVPGLGRQFGIRYDRRMGLTPAQCDTVATNRVVWAVARGGGGDEGTAVWWEWRRESLGSPRPAPVVHAAEAVMGAPGNGVLGAGVGPRGGKPWSRGVGEASYTPPPP